MEHDKQAYEFLKIQNRLYYEINKTASLRRALEICIEAALESSDMDVAGIYLVVADGGIEMMCHKGLRKDIAEAVRYFGKDAPHVKRIMEGAPVYFGTDANPFPKTVGSDGEFYKSLAAIPFKYKGQVIGCLNVGSKTLDVIPEVTRNMLESIGNMVGGLIGRIRTEENLKESEERFRLSFEEAKDAILWADADSGILINCNKSAEKLLERTKNEIIGQHHSIMHPPDTVDEHKRMFLEHVGRAGADNDEARIITKSGKTVPVHISSTVVNIAGKRINQGIFRDISERKRAEEALRISEHKYRRLTENLREDYFFYSHGTDGVFTYLSPSVKNMLGYTPEEFMTHYTNYLTDDPVNKLVEHHTELSIRGEQQPPYDVEIFHKDGGRRRLEVSEAPVFDDDGRVIAVEGVAHDITSRRLAEEALRKSEEQFRLMFDNTKDAIIWSDAESGLIVNCNRSAELLFERPRNEIIGAHKSTLIQPNEAVDGSALSADGADPFTAHITGEAAVFAKSGRNIPVHISSAVNIIDGKPVNIEFIRDISELKAMQAEKEALLQELHQSQKMETIGHLAGGIAHDFNNILAIIIGTAGLLINRFEEHDPAVKYVDRINRVANRAKDLTMKLLAFARKEKLETKTVSSNELVLELGELLKRSISKKISIEIETAPNASLVSVDMNQILQALLNVSVNACDAMPENGSLYIYCDEVSLSKKDILNLPGVTPGKYCRISVEDTGHGIPDEIRDKIFEPFFTTKERGKGTGLGLPITLRIIQNHKGTIAIDSSRGKGTTVGIYLPVADSPADTPQAAVPEKQDAAGSGTVLVVDDENDILEMMTEILRENGMNAIPACGAARAFELFRKHKNEINLVILDMMMPQVDGVEAFRILRTIDPGVKVIVCSGFSVEGKASLILADGAIGFLQKPFSAGQLLKIVTDAIKH